MILSDCREHSIRSQYLQQTPSSYTSYTVVMSEAQGGKRTFFHHRGANQLFGSAHIPLSQLTDRIFYLGYLLLLDSLDQQNDSGKTRAAAVLEQARALGMYTAVDLVSEASDRFTTVVPPALPHVDYLFLNEYEAGKITGMPVTAFNQALLSKVTGKILEMGVNQAVFLHFPEGAVVHTQAGDFLSIGSVNIPSEQIKGTSGAGDAFAAGVLWAIHQGQTWQACLEQGTCAAAASLFDAGTSASIKPMAKCLELALKLGRKPQA
jgi:sugar/nucleoside kinase (ribokinase family)